MIDHHLEKKGHQEGTRINQDLLGKSVDIFSRFTRLGPKVLGDAEKTKVDLTAAVVEGSAQVNDRIEKLSSIVKETTVNAAEAVKTDIEQGLKKYNANAQNIANELPGSLGKKAVRYPWVAVSIALVIGIILGGLLKTMLSPYPRRHGF